MKILLDTNIIVSDFKMNSLNFQILFENCKKGNDQIYIPMIVKDETINKFRQRLKDARITTNKEIRIYNDLTGNKIEFLINDKELEINVVEYENFVNQLFADNKIIVLPYTKISHEIIAKRAINKKKPFNTNGAGYRDNLIWENIKELLTQDQDILFLPELFFITNNYKDFADIKYELHSDLIVDLENNLYNPSSIQIFSSLNDYIEKKGKVHLEQERKLEEKLKNKEFDEIDLQLITCNFLLGNFINHEVNTYEIGLPQDYENPSINSINEDYEIENISVKKLSDTKVLIDVDFDLEVDIDFFLFKSEYWCMDEKNQPSILDEDWNEQYVWALTTNEINLSMSILINSEMKVLSCQINKVSKNSSYKL